VIAQPPLFEQFAALRDIPFVRHAFTLRAPHIEVSPDKATALRRLDHLHAQVRDEIGMAGWPFVTAQQIHGAAIHLIDSDAVSHCVEGCDGLVTDRPGVCLGIYVADCCAVYLVDPVRRAIGLVHSGRKGTELAIASHALETMRRRLRCNPANMIVLLSPCIRVPHYEVDFAGAICAQCRQAGVAQVHDANVCTACDLERYYSYRAEKGNTGRMLALLGLAGD
jgi:copper oxidase (laccase) domain-containing protein